MRNPFKPRKAPAQTWSAKRSSVLSADDPVFQGLDEAERKSLEATPPIRHQGKPSQDLPREPLKHAGGDGAFTLSAGPGSHDSIGTDSGHGYAAVAGAFAGADHSSH
ncbi:hypothetical protein ColTof4_13260 [Colletotrichum tofieldiae]|uniref:Uncharacterized protein n=1 Tax=Colletotrichum tofieldiae TaxID=708197 RepID=A0A161W0Q7_9PEZI|nr:hypothetical protein CT0861_07138 [Colletotrichum tofieldiae]GKT52762.1 hypothetical protein ColTof3_00101 [Colletotrichum tofieldiae]GKT80837.1 hypothetical protein ColTof4_13260 [Colletotrichum tofieldiae]GKT88970.1 hypothetical protein Ct61P_06820 [Colletotrichum tofieldiae]